MEVEPRNDPARVFSDVAQHNGGETGPIRDLPAPALANVSDKPLHVTEHHVEVRATLDVKDEPYKEEEVKRDSEVTIVAASHQADERGEKEESHQQIDHLSAPNPPAAESSGADITHNDLSGDPVEEEEVEGEIVVGSLDVCLLKIPYETALELTRAGRFERNGFRTRRYDTTVSVSTTPF
jgi:hypothetical protein